MLTLFLFATTSYNTASLNRFLLVNIIIILLFKKINKINKSRQQIYKNSENAMPLGNQ